MNHQPHGFRISFNEHDPGGRRWPPCPVHLDPPSLKQVLRALQGCWYRFHQCFVDLWWLVKCLMIDDEWWMINFWWLMMNDEWSIFDDWWWLMNEHFFWWLLMIDDWWLFWSRFWSMIVDGWWSGCCLSCLWLQKLRSLRENGVKRGGGGSVHKHMCYFFAYSTALNALMLSLLKKWARLATWTTWARWSWLLLSDITRIIHGCQVL